MCVKISVSFFFLGVLNHADTMNVLYHSVELAKVSLLFAFGWLRFPTRYFRTIIIFNYMAGIDFRATISLASYRLDYEKDTVFKSIVFDDIHIFFLFVFANICFRLLLLPLLMLLLLFFPISIFPSRSCIAHFGVMHREHYTFDHVAYIFIFLYCHIFFVCCCALIKNAYPLRMCVRTVRCLCVWTGMEKNANIRKHVHSVIYLITLSKY